MLNSRMFVPLTVMKETCCYFDEIVIGASIIVIYKSEYVELIFTRVYSAELICCLVDVPRYAIEDRIVPSPANNRQWRGIIKQRIKPWIIGRFYLAKPHEFAALDNLQIRSFSCLSIGQAKAFNG